MNVLIIADDLTGAMDAAVPFRLRGLTASVAITPGIAAVTASADVVAISTASRDLPSPDAAAVVTSELHRLSGATPHLIIKKIDSTGRGNIAPETVAALTATGRNLAVVCPALPAQGRTVVDGHVLVGGHGAVEAGFAEAANTSLVDLFREFDPGLEVIAAKPSDPLPEAAGPTVVVYDATTDADLTAIADAILEARHPVIAAGSSGLTSALAGGLLGHPDQPRGVLLQGPLCFVIGTRSAASRAQIAMLMNAGVLPLESAGNTPPRDPSLLIADTASDQSPVDVLARLASRAIAHARATRPRTMFLAGGDTAAAMLAGLGVGSIMIDAELMPGVVAGSVTTELGPMTVVTKAGGFGAEDTFAKILAAVRPSSAS